MLSPVGLNPKDALTMRDYGHLPTPNEVAAVQLQHARRRLKFWQWEWRVLLLVERVALGLRLRRARRRAPWYNPFVETILRSPLHAVLSRKLLLITVRGRKSGRTITTPVNYVHASGGNLYILSRRERSWWRNLYGGAYVTVRVRGQDRVGFGTASADDQSIANEFARNPNLAARLRVARTQRGKLDSSDLQKLAARYVLVRVHVD